MPLVTTPLPSPRTGADKTVLVGPVHYSTLCPEGRTLLVDAGFTVVENPGERPFTTAELVPHLAGVDAVIGGLEVWDEPVLQQAPRLKVIGRLGVGLDNVDLDAAARHGVAVTNVPGGNANAVAELAIGSLIALQRKITTMGVDLRAGRWDRYVGSEITGKRIGLVGFGATARLVARRLSGFDVEILVHDPYLDPQAAAAAGVRAVPLAELLASVDVVSLHAPDTASTHHLVNAETLALLQPHAVLVNTSRGGLVDEAALVDALRAGRLAGAALDVWADEPLAPDNPLLALPNVVATSHAAADTVEAYRTVGLTTAQAVIDVFDGRTPANLRNDPGRDRVPTLHVDASS